MKRRKLINELKTSRIKPSKYFENFLDSFSRATRLAHYIHRFFNHDQLLTAEAKRNYIIALASCLETFYRDLLVHVLSKDSSHLESLTAKIKEKKTLLDIYKMFEEKIEFHEYVASHFNFQNVEEIENAFGVVFLPDGYLRSLEQHRHSCYILSKSDDPIDLALPLGWRKDYASLFRIRHKLVHDSNAPCDIPSKHIATLENLVLMICQFSSFMIDEKYGNTLALKKNGKPAFLIVDDFLSDDWEISGDDKGQSYIVDSKP